MAKNKNSLPRALKHGGFAGTTILPGESQVAFAKLFHDLRSDLCPKGAMEEDVIISIARLIWRKQNLKIFSDIQAAREDFLERLDRVLNKAEAEEIASRDADRERDLEEIRAGMSRTDWTLHNSAGELTLDSLCKELEVIDRIDGMIDRCFKRLLLVRGVKSLSVSTNVPTLTGPPDAGDPA
jgi:hypothetical protein